MSLLLLLSAMISYFSLRVNKRLNRGPVKQALGRSDSLESNTDSLLSSCLVDVAIVLPQLRTLTYLIFPTFVCKQYLDNSCLL
jgi:hypothetical protein